MFVTKLIKDRKTREKLEDRIELVMATLVIAGFVYNKINGDKDEERDERED